MDGPNQGPNQRFDDEAESGGSFVVGLLAGTVLGAGLAMIFGPKASLSGGHDGSSRSASEAPDDEGGLDRPAVVEPVSQTD